MRNALVLLLSVPLVAACTVGPDEGGGGSGTGSGSGSGSGSGGGGGGGINGDITSNTSWSGTVLLGGITNIAAGVTVTVEPGTVITVKDVASLQIAGVFDVQGTGASPVMIKPEGTGTAAKFGAFTIQAGGELKYKHVEQYGGGIYSATATSRATITDSFMSRAPSADFVMMNGGTLDLSYSQVGLEPGEIDSTHCDLHFGGAGNIIKVTHSTISTSAYGLMFYGGMNADFKYNNWFGNTVDVDTTNTAPVTGDFSMGWFEKGAPTGAGLTADNLAAARLVACDGTNDATCAGPRP